MKVSLDKFSLEIDHANSTAKISISPQANGNVVIPRIIKYQSNEYLIVGINEDAFRNNTHVRGIIFPRDSAVKIINKMFHRHIKHCFFKYYYIFLYKKKNN